MQRNTPNFGRTAPQNRHEDRLPDRPQVYLAGPDVFFPDAMQRAGAMKAALAARGMEGLFPLDSEFGAEVFADPKKLGLAIARANEALMRKADIVLANIQPWRGVEADDGTSYEIGFMAALGKIVVLYTNDHRPFVERIVSDVYRGVVVQQGQFKRGARDGMMIEDFEGFADNLMLINAAVESAERATGERVDPATIVQFSFDAAADLAYRLWTAP
jgi:nucleoside 2-deoxyribosyltransferase